MALSTGPMFGAKDSRDADTTFRGHVTREKSLVNLLIWRGWPTFDLTGMENSQDADTPDRGKEKKNSKEGKAHKRREPLLH